MNQSQAFTQALLLALTARTDEQTARAVDLAEELAQGLTPEQISNGQYAASALWEAL